MGDIDIASCADDNTPYIVGDKIDKVVSDAPLFKWFSNNQMKANPDICHLLIDESFKKEIMRPFCYHQALKG